MKLVYICVIFFCVDLVWADHGSLFNGYKSPKRRKQKRNFQYEDYCSQEIKKFESACEESEKTMKNITTHNGEDIRLDIILMNQGKLLNKIDRRLKQGDKVMDLLLENQQRILSIIEPVFQDLGNIKAFLDTEERKMNIILENQKQILSSINDETYKQKQSRIKTVKKSYPRSCFDLLKLNDVKSGIRTVYPYDTSPQKGVEVLCNQDIDGGGWTVFQYRNVFLKRENFFRNWADYSNGFGQLTGEFWMGLKILNIMTKHRDTEMRIELQDSTGEKRYALYNYFSVENSAKKFRLNVDLYNGTSGDSLSYHNNMEFSTYDQDNDRIEGENCAKSYKGAWWYNRCLESNLNGFQYVGEHDSYADGINWDAFRGYFHSMAKTAMMFRPRYRKL